MDEQLILVNAEGVRYWSDGLRVPNRIIKKHFALLYSSFDYVQTEHLSVNMPNSEVCFTFVKWLGVMIEGFVTWLVSDRIDFILQLLKPTMLDDVCVLLVMSRHLR